MELHFLEIVQFLILKPNILLLDIDDLWLPDKLTTQISYVKSKDINFSFTAYELIDILESHSIGFGIMVIKFISYNDMLKKSDNRLLYSNVKKKCF